MKFEILYLCISEEKGTQKHAVSEIELIEDYGIKNDAHAGTPERQVSLLADEDISTMRSKGLTLAPGAFGENIITRGIDLKSLKIGEKLAINDVVLEITRIGKECHSRCAIYYQTGDCIMPRVGVFARVLRGGKIRAQDCGYYPV